MADRRPQPERDSGRNVLLSRRGGRELAVDASDPEPRLRWSRMRQWIRRFSAVRVPGGVALAGAAVGLSSVTLSLLARSQPIAVPAITWPVLLAMLVTGPVLVRAISSLDPAWATLRRVLTVLTMIAIAYPGLWSAAVMVSTRAPDTSLAWATATLAGVGHLPIIAAFSVVPLISVRYLGSGSGRSLLLAVITLGAMAATSFVLFFGDFEPLSASALVPSNVGARVGMTVNLLYLGTVLLGPGAALVMTWRSAADVSAARRLALVAGSALAGTLLVMICGVVGGDSTIGAAVVLIGMYAALAVVVTGCVRALAITDPGNPQVGEVRGRTEQAAIAALTGRENEVLRLLAEGLSNAGIAARLVVSERTVDAHLRSVFQKLDLPQGPEHNRRVQASNAWRRETIEARRSPDGHVWSTTGPSVVARTGAELGERADAAPTVRS